MATQNKPHPAKILLAQLKRFSDAQLAGLSPAKITAVTAHLILTASFFTGAIMCLAANKGLKKADYLPALKFFLAETFGLTPEHAAGLIESNARMYKRYKLIEKVYQRGWAAAQAWQQDNTSSTTVLKDLLGEHHDLSMSDLHLEGIKQPPAPKPATLEEAAAEETAPPPARRSRLSLWLLLLLLTAAAAGYYWYFYLS